MPLQVQNETKIDCIIHHLHYGIVYKYEGGTYILLPFFFVNNKCNSFGKQTPTKMSSIDLSITRNKKLISYSIASFLDTKLSILPIFSKVICELTITQSSHPFYWLGCGVVSFSCVHCFVTTLRYQTRFRNCFCCQPWNVAHRKNENDVERICGSL